MTEQRLNQLEVVCPLLAAPFLLFPSALSVPALVLLLVPWALRWRVRGSPTLRTPMDVPILCLLVMVVISVWCSPLPQESVRKLLGIILGVACFYAVANSARTRGWIWCWILLLIAGGVGVSLLSLFGTDWASYKTLPLQPVYQRLPRLLHNVTTYGEGGFHPNEVGGTLALVVPVALAACLALLSQDSGWPAAALDTRVPRAPLGTIRRWTIVIFARMPALTFTALGFVVVTVAFVLTQSRSAYVGVAVGLVVFGVARSRWFLIALIVIVALALTAGFQLGIEDSIETLAQAQSARLSVGRFEIWRRALALIQDFPYTGVGLNAFPYVSDTMYPYPSRGPSGVVPHAHNTLLQVGVDLGVPGIVAYMGLFVTFTLCAWRIHHIALSGWQRLLTAGVFAGLVAHQVYGLTDTITLGAKPGFMMWILLGLMAALHQLQAAPAVRAGARASFWHEGVTATQLSRDKGESDARTNREGGGVLQ